MFFNKTIFIYIFLLVSEDDPLVGDQRLIQHDSDLLSFLFRLLSLQKAGVFVIRRGQLLYCLHVK